MKHQKSTLFLILSLLIGSNTVTQAQLIVTESFEAAMSPGSNQGDCACINYPDQFSDGSSDYYGRQNNGTISANGGVDYSGFAGSHYFAGEDHDSSDCNSPCTPTLSFIMEDITVPNPTESRIYQVAFLAGGNDSNGSYDSVGDVDFLNLEYSVNDQATYTPLICFTTTATPLNVLSEDSDCVLPGDGINNLSQAMQSFTAIFTAINPTNNQIHLRVSANSGGSNEEWAIDNITITDMGPSVPVELERFAATREKEEVILQWQTAVEINNRGFEVERSVNGEAWETISWVAGNDISRTVQQYSYTDKAPGKGSNYYRLKQVDFDGSFEHSEVIQVKMEQRDDIRIFPNPTSGDLYIQGIEEADARLEVYNGIGQLVKSEYLDTETINLSDLPKGLYFIAVYENEKLVANQSIVKK